MSDNKKYSYLLKNTFLLTLSSFGSKIMTFLLVPLYTEVLSSSDYGTADIISTSAMLFVYIFSLNIGASVLRFALDKNEKSDRVLLFSLKVLGIGTFVVALGMLLFIAFNVIDFKPVYYAFLLVIFFVDALRTIMFQYVRAIDMVKVMAIASLTETLIRLLTNILTLLVFGWGLYGYLISLVIGPIVSIVYCSAYIFPLNKSDFDKEYETRLRKEMISYAIPSAISQLGWWANNSLDKYFLIAIKGSAVNGVYAIAYKVPGVMSMLCNIFSQAWGISAIKDYTEDDKDGFFSKTYSTYHALLVCVCTGMILCNVPLATFLYRKDFFTAWKYCPALIIAMMFSGLSSFYSGIFNAVKKNKDIAKTTIIGALVNIVLNAILIPYISALGAAIATAVSFYVVWLGRLVLSRRYLKFKIKIIRDHIVYALLVLQCIFDHMDNHFYIGQAAIVLLIALLNVSEIKACFVKIKGIVLRKRKA